MGGPKASISSGDIFAHAFSKACALAAFTVPDKRIWSS